MAKNFRTGRLGEEIRKLISEMLLRDLKDPRLTSGMISISEVEVTKDNSFATVYLDVFAPGVTEEEQAEKEEAVLAGLASASGLIRKEIGKQMKLRRVPELLFRIDRSQEYGRHIDEVMKNLGL